MPTARLLRDYEDLLFAFSISDAMAPQSRALRLDLWSLGLLWLVGPTCILFASSANPPVSTFLLIVVFELIPWVFRGSFSALNAMVFPWLPWRSEFDSSVRLGILIGAIGLVGHELLATTPRYAGTVGFFVAAGAVALATPWEGWRMWRRLPGFLQDILSRRPLLSMMHLRSRAGHLCFWLYGIDWRNAALVIYRDLKKELSVALKNILFVGADSFTESLYHFAAFLGIVIPYAAAMLALYIYLDFPIINAPFREWPDVARLTVSVFLLVTVIVIPLSTSAVVAYLRFLRDSRTIKTLMIPGQIDRRWIHAICRGLQEHSGRIRFLQGLRLMAVSVTGSWQPLPDEPWVNDQVQEEFARLEATWVGLED